MIDYYFLCEIEEVLKFYIAYNNLIDYEFSGIYYI